ncbi:histidine phosphatase family protein [Thiorhodococcus mannitoliphagus]|uniref:Histidine phosphatase family protein n=1 Tax=Thiorhodococcus mannitoliphagus TaxID=329406 RepID=A0A6P1DXY5_9GAMM|nr:histidine phosphatase family protein [Thiorhodococcus mannitoliphagus]NEX21851.1 histidine phosphatase family protein [Thiorhodococcus mannitoliphagus]
MTTVTRLCVTRHGETDWNNSGILQGWTDVPLNDQGREQSHALAQALGGAGFQQLCSSPLGRSLETAEIVAADLGLPPPKVYDGLKERHFGDVQGMPKAELLLTHPGLHQEILRRNPACDFAGGETMDAFADRVMEALELIAEDYPGSQTLVITHGWVMDVITRQLRGLPRAAILNMKRRNGESLWLERLPGADLSEVPSPLQQGR